MDGQAVPKTAQGPSSEAPYPRCYQGDLVGALTAAANIYQLGFGNSAIARAVRDNAYVNLSPQNAAKMAATPSTVTILGFKVLRPIESTGTTKIEVVVSVVPVSSGQPFIAGAPMTMTWADNDWRVLLGDRDQFDNSPSAYVRWSSR